MAIIEELKLVIGYYENNLDWLFAIFALVLLIGFIQMFFGLIARSLGIWNR